MAYAGVILVQFLLPELLRVGNVDGAVHAGFGGGLMARFGMPLFLLCVLPSRARYNCRGKRGTHDKDGLLLQSDGMHWLQNMSDRVQR